VLEQRDGRHRHLEVVGVVGCEERGLNQRGVASLPGRVKERSSVARAVLVRLAGAVNLDFDPSHRPRKLGPDAEAEAVEAGEVLVDPFEGRGQVVRPAVEAAAGFLG